MKNTAVCVGTRCPYSALKVKEKAPLEVKTSVTHFVLYPSMDRITPTKEQQREMVEALEKMKSVYQLFYPDEVFGKSWRKVIYTYGYLGQAYHNLGDDEKAFLNLRKCAELAKRFDMISNETERHSFFFEGTAYKRTMMRQYFLIPAYVLR